MHLAHPPTDSPDIDTAIVALLDRCGEIPEHIASLVQAHVQALDVLAQARAQRAAAQVEGEQRLARLREELAQAERELQEQGRLLVEEEGVALVRAGRRADELLDALDEALAPAPCEATPPGVLQRPVQVLGRCASVGGALAVGEGCRKSGRDPWCHGAPEARRAAFRLIEGGRAARELSPREKRELLRRELDRALHKLFLAAKRYRLGAGLRFDAELSAGVDLRAALDGSRKHLRHWQAAVSAGYLAFDSAGGAVVRGKTPVRLTQKGADWLAGEMGLLVAA